MYKLVYKCAILLDNVMNHIVNLLAQYFWVKYSISYRFQFYRVLTNGSAERPSATTSGQFYSYSSIDSVQLGDYVATLLCFPFGWININIAKLTEDGRSSIGQNSWAQLPVVLGHFLYLSLDAFSAS